MTTIAHLKLIKAECERLLALSEKRTQGKWESGISTWNKNGKPFRTPILSKKTIANTYDVKSHVGCASPNADYIAACAGAAEAGWRSTIATIELIFELDALDMPMPPIADLTTTKDILAAWPIETLK